MGWKKIFVATGFIIIGIALYLVSVFVVSRNAIGFTILLPIFIFAHVVLSVLYPIKKYSKKILAVIIVLFLINVAINQIAFPACDSNHKNGPITSCDCFGIKKSELFSSQCIGFRTACYEYNQTLMRTWQEVGQKGDLKFEVPCP
jgi:hypothetical protein